MIHGIGTDMVSVTRIRQALARHGDRFAYRILAPGERQAYHDAPQPERLLAKRFAAKEAFGKAYGTGVAVPATLHSVAISRDALGKPHYIFHGQMAEIVARDGLRTHVSLSDELDYVVAFAVIEKDAA
ncbi:holo-ACP synthase [Denitromonas halophila]|uniref:Holo-[acyl-carrier-protein] synthase n=1 Tax=Denitromonas halophila TaxID=1629404 RepID=A0A557QK96_9RHOO|nr:holo-ACP synthase [Denitromonas halophila]TVO53326.1 holo-ACP synthase [Denitromonas halophila]